MAEQLRLAVAVDVDERGRLTVGHVEDVMSGPVAALAGRIHENEGRLARQAEDQQVRPAVACEVVGELDEVVGVACRRVVGRLARAARIVALRGVGDLLLEVRAEPEEATGRHVELAIVVEVGDRTALGHEVLGDGLLGERDLGGREDGDRSEEGKGGAHRAG